MADGIIHCDKNNLISVWHQAIKPHFLLWSGKVCGNRGK
jgi:hypothetical protein